MSTTWIDAAGYRKRRTTEGLLMVAVAGPITWCFINRDFDSARFRLALLLFFVGVLLTKAWSASGIRCHCCKVPIYLYWSLGFPTGHERRSFGTLTECPYCGDTGTGKTGDPTAVDPTTEARRVRRNLIFSALVLLAGFWTIVLAVAYGAAAS